MGEEKLESKGEKKTKWWQRLHFHALVQDYSLQMVHLSHGFDMNKMFRTPPRRVATDKQEITLTQS